MKAAVIICRNDNYGGNLHHRARKCLANLSKVFDKVYVVDWKSINDTTLLEAANIKIDNVVDIKITKDIILRNWPNTINIPIVETIGRNIGIRRAIQDGFEWICSTNIDIICSPFDESILNKDTLYTVRKYHIPEHLHLNQYIDLNLNFLISNKNSFQRVQLSVIDGKPVWDPGDVWSLIVGCGDFQMAHSSLWNEIKGFEEEAVGRSYADSNVMKKPVLVGKKAEILNLDIFHMDHGNSAYREQGESLPINDRLQYVNNFTQTTNTENWGLYK